MKAKILILLLTFVCVLSHGQTNNFIKGYVVTSANDTLQGFIKDEPRSKLSEQLIFKPSLTAEIESFVPSSLRAVYFEPTFVFEPQTLEIDGEEQTLLLRKLVDGATDLYEYQSPKIDGKYIYFLVKADGTFMQLENPKAAVRVTDKKYLGKLNYFFSDCPTMVNQNSSTPFNGTTFVKLTMQYNQCVAPDLPATALDKDKKTKIRFGGVLSVGRYEADLAPPIPPFRNTSYAGTSLQFGVLVNLTAINRISVESGIYYVEYDKDVAIDLIFRLEELSYNVNAIEIPVNVRYRISKSKISPYLYGGVRTGFFLNSSADYIRIDPANGAVNTDETYDFNELISNVLGGNAGVGLSIMLSDRKEVLMDFGIKRMTYSTAGFGENGIIILDYALRAGFLF